MISSRPYQLLGITHCILVIIEDEYYIDQMLLTLLFSVKMIHCENKISLLAVYLLTTGELHISSDLLDMHYSYEQTVAVLNTHVTAS